MKIFATIGVAVALAVTASAATFTTPFIACGSGFSYSGGASTLNGGAPFSSSSFSPLTCTSYAALGLPALDTFASSAIIVTNDYTGGTVGSNPLAPQENSTATFYSDGGNTGFAVSSDTLFTNGTPDSTNYLDSNNFGVVGKFFSLSTTEIAAQAGSSIKVAYVNYANGATATCSGPGCAANNPTLGSVQGTSGQVFVQYTYTTGTPEPVSMVLFGSGLLALSLIGRKKLVRK